MPRKLTLEFIKQEFEKEGYVLLSDEYINNTQKLDYICTEGHGHSISWGHWQQGRRCCFCCKYQNRYIIEDIKKEFEKENYILLTKKYINNSQKLNYICPNGHKHFIRWANWQQGQRCPYCVGLAKKTIELIKSEFEKENYTLLTKVYKNNKQKLKYICPKGHEHDISWNEWENQGNRCPFCSNNISKWEKEIKKFITDLNIDYIPNDRTKLVNPETNRFLELDIWFPKLNKAIECNGIYWHENKMIETNDEIKQHLCKKHGVDLFILTDKEWGNNERKCKNKIKKFLEIGEVEYGI